MLTFVVHVRRTSEIQARVVLLFHGRRMEIDSPAAGLVERSEVLRIEVIVKADQDRTRLIEAKLNGLADVLLVERNDPREKAARKDTGDGRCKS